MGLLTQPTRAATTVLTMDQWANVDIGTTPVAGSGIFNATAGTYTVAGSGADIWGSTDNFHYSYQALSGDAVITARVDSVTNTNAWTKVGVMIRETLLPGSTYAMMMVTPSSGVGLQYRAGTGSSTSVNVMTTGLTAPRWIKLERRGNVFSGYQSADGVTWILSQRVAIAMAANVNVGLAACSHVTTSTLATAVFSQVLLDPTTSSMALPWPWTESAIGTSTDQGVALYDSSYVLSNLGADIWSPADKLKFVGQSLTGDGTLVVKVSSIASSDSWSRFGPMMRETLDAGAKNVLLSLTTGNGLVFQSRSAANGNTAFLTSAVSKSAPVWLKLDRTGSTFTASYSADGATWTTQGSSEIAMNASIQVGVAYANRSTSTWAFGVGDQLKLVTPFDTDGNGLPDAWEMQYFGHLGVNLADDPDGDGLTNSQEWELGTNPTVATPSGQQPSLTLVSGGGQTGATGAVLPQPLVVKVADATTGAPLPGLLVTFRLLSGQGLFSSADSWQTSVSLLTDANGLVQTNFQLPITAGATVAQASLGKQPAVATFSLTALLGAPGSTFLLNSTDIGAVSQPAQNQYQGGTYTFSAKTSDIWGTADSMDYAWQSWTGDGILVTRVSSLTASDAWAKAGLMFRETTDANSRQVMIAVTPGNGVAFQWRDATGGSCGSVNTTGLTAPKWLALRRSNGVVYGYYSNDGHAWTLLGSRSLVTTGPVCAGLAFASHNSTLAQATFDTLSLSSLAPTPWQMADIGAYNAGGVDEFTADTMRLRAGGNDIWGTADSFRYAYQALAADGNMVVRVASQTNTSGWAKSGLMIRESSAANARYVILAQTPINGVTLQARAQTGASAYAVATLAGPVAPNWLKLERLGSAVNAYESADGVSWTPVGSVNWGFGSSLIGLAAASLTTSASIETLFDNISLQDYASQSGWSGAYFLTNDLSGQPAALRRDASIDFTWPVGQAPASGVPVSNYSVRWQGILQPQTSDTYTFTVLSNGGVRLWVDGNLVIDHWALQSAPVEVSGQAVLQAGSQPKVVLEYFNGSDAGRIQLRWSSSTLADADIATGAVQPTDSDNDGIPDSWETAHGLNPFDASDAVLAPDGDGLTNLAKYQLGLAPGQNAGRVSGGVMLEEWLNITGNNISNLINNSRFSGTPDQRSFLTSLETIPNRMVNYGDRIRGYIVPPVDGSYQFWIAGDDSAEFWLSPTDSPFDRVRISSAPTYTGFESYDEQPSQKSVPIILKAGQYYYFEVLKKQGIGSDNLSVAWTRPDSAREVIGSAYLATFVPRTDNISGDGLPDAWKTANGLDITKGCGVNGAYGDPDGDGLNNLAEYQAGTNPNATDTDGDGFSDKMEVLAGFSPTDPTSHPTGTAPWTYADIGVVDATGNACGTSAGGYLLTGNGGGIYGASGLTHSSDDAFRFLYQSVTGDFDFATKVTNVGANAGTGALVVRDGFATKTTSASIKVDDTGEFRFQVRPDAVSDTIILKKTLASAFSWLRLQRKGQVINGYYSADGQYWTLYYSAIVNLPATCDVGMAVWSPSAPTWQIFSNLNLQIGAVPASETQVNGLDPLIPNIAGTTLTSYTGSAGVASFGSWNISGSADVSNTVQATLDFDIQIPADGAYILEIEAQSGDNSTLNADFPVQVSIDGQFIDLVDLLLPPGQVGLAHIGTPWLKAGTHHVSLFYDNTQTYRSLQVNALRVQTIGGTDADNNGIPDWEDTRLNALNSLKPIPTASFTSPVCVEGVSRFLSMMTLTASGQPVIPTVGPGYGWYANVPLSQSDPVTVNASFENGVLNQSLSFAWQTLNLLADNSATIPTGVLRIRQGDSLLITASSVGSIGGSAVITVSQPGFPDVQVPVPSPQSAPVPYLFTQPGTYTLTGSYTDSTGALATDSLTVQVVQAQFNGTLSVGLGTVLNWSNPQIPTGIFLEADQGLSLQLLTPLAAGGEQIAVSTQNPGTSYAVARLSDGGPILSQTTVYGLTIAHDGTTSNDTLATYADGSQLMATWITVNNITPDMQIVISIFVKGVTFDDGTIIKTLTAADFDQYGRVQIKFIYPAGLKTSYCHRIQVYRGSTYLGEF